MCFVITGNRILARLKVISFPNECVAFGGKACCDATSRHFSAESEKACVPSVEQWKCKKGSIIAKTISKCFKQYTMQNNATSDKPTDKQDKNTKAKSMETIYTSLSKKYSESMVCVTYDCYRIQC